MWSWHKAAVWFFLSFLYSYQTVCNFCVFKYDAVKCGHTFLKRMTDGILQNDASREITAKAIKDFFHWIFAPFLNDKRKQLHCTSGLYMVAINRRLQGEVWKKARRRKGGGSKTCVCHRQKTKTEIMLHIQEIFSCWNKLGAHKCRHVRSVHTPIHLPGLK